MESDCGSEGNLGDSRGGERDEISRERAMEVQRVMRVMRECCEVLRAAGREDLADQIAAWCVADG